MSSSRFHTINTPRIPPEPTTYCQLQQRDPAELQPRPSSRAPGSSHVCASKPRHQPSQLVLPVAHRAPHQGTSQSMQSGRSRVQKKWGEEKQRENHSLQDHQHHYNSNNHQQSTHRITHYKTISITTIATTTNSQLIINLYKTYNNKYSYN